MTLVAVLLAALLAAAAAPWPGRPTARSLLVVAVLLAPPAAVGVLLATRGRGEAGSWLLLFPLTFAWLAWIDLRFGIAARLARPAARTKADARDGDAA